MTGPTLWTTTMVFLLAAATAWTRALPLCCVLRQPKVSPFDLVECKNMTRTQGSRLFLSPAFPSTVMYPSPESEVMTTIAASAPETVLATLPVLSLLLKDKVVPSAEVRVFNASYGAER